MTGPDTEVTIGETIGNLIRYRCVLNPRLTLVIDIAPKTTFVKFWQQAIWHELADIPATRLDTQLIRLERIGQEILNIVSEQAAPFFAGERSAEDCAARIQERVKIYLSEQCP